MGDFNQCNKKTHPMRKGDDGGWKKFIIVPPGRYEYRFLVDGQWWNDPANNQICSKQVFDERGIEIPFPHRTLYMGESKKGKAPPMHIRIDEKPGGQRPSPETPLP